jgi:hypothetical protein
MDHQDGHEVLPALGLEVIPDRTAWPSGPFRQSNNNIPYRIQCVKIKLSTDVNRACR